ncbi:MAG: alpha/beta hydrolase [Caulobacter sp.]|nr:alpha/beta hydrolase [Caulobacter sp.]
MYRGLILCLALLLTACGQDGGRAPFTESRTPPGLSARFLPPEGWAWGLVQAGGFPAQRYGVSAPSTGPLAHIVILPGYGDSAESWFETAAQFNARGYIVWVLEGAGQGGSGRFTSGRDVGHIPDMEPDLLGVKALLRTVVPDDGKPVILVGERSGAAVAVLAAQRGYGGDALVLLAPWKPAGAGPHDEIASRLGLGGFREPWAAGWSRDQPPPPSGDAYRAAVPRLWQQVNPDLRMGSPSLGGRLAMARGWDQALAALPGLTRPVTMIDAPPSLAVACTEPNCRTVPTPPGARGPFLHLQADAARAAWMGAVDAMVARQRADQLAAEGFAPDHGL